MIFTRIISLKQVKTLFVFSMLGLFFLSNSLNAQITIAANTSIPVGDDVPIVIQTSGNVRVDEAKTFKNTSLVLNGTSQNLNFSGPVVFEELDLNNGTNVSLTGNSLHIRRVINFDNGILNTGGNKVLYSGSGILTGNESSFIQGPFTQLGSGTRSYPIGSSDGIYAPIVLDGVAEEDVEITLEAIRENPNVSNLPLEIPTSSESWYWYLSESGGFSGALVTLPVLSEDEALFSGDEVAGVVLQANEDRNAVVSLGGSLGSETVRSSQAGTGPVFLLGTQLQVDVSIHNIISPNGDGFNDYLFIENLELLGDQNIITIVDRWGVKVFEQEGFSNFDAITNPYDGTFDFLEPGNYVCILRVEGRDPISQTVTVVKN